MRRGPRYNMGVPSLAHLTTISTNLFHACHQCFSGPVDASSVRFTVNDRSQFQLVPQQNDPPTIIVDLTASHDPQANFRCQWLDILSLGRKSWKRRPYHWIYINARYCTIELCSEQLHRQSQLHVTSETLSIILYCINSDVSRSSSK